MKKPKKVDEKEVYNILTDFASLLVTPFNLHNPIDRNELAKAIHKRIGG